MSHQPVLPVCIDQMTLEHLSRALIEIADNCPEWRDELNAVAWTLKDRQETKAALLKEIEEYKRRARGHDEEVRILNENIDYLERKRREAAAQRG